MSKIDLESTLSGYQAAASLRRNFEAIEAEFQDKVLYRDNPAGEPNSMENDLDMNSNRIINLPSATSASEPATYGQLTSIGTLIQFTGTATETATATAGQTVFTLETTTYTPGSDNVSVYIGGIKQYPSAYVEVSPTSLTFSEGLSEGDEVLFVVNERSVDTSTVPASSVTTTVDGNITDVNTHLNIISGLETVSDMKSVDIPIGSLVHTKGYTTAGGIGAATYLITTSVVVDGYINHTLVNGHSAIIQLEDNEINSGQAGIIGDGTDEKLPIYALEEYIFTNKVNCLFLPGTFDVGNANWPFRQSTFVALKDYEGVIVRGSGKAKSIFRTTSALGADVLQLNAIKGLTIIDASVTAVLTGSAGSGSNGLSITNGGEDLYIDVDAFDCPGLDKTTFMDGGKAYTIQNGLSVLPFKNIKVRGKATNCTYGYNQDAAYEDFDAVTQPMYEGVDIDFVAEDCWRGVTFGGAAAISALAENQRDCGIKVRAVLINCTQPLVCIRWVRADIDVTIAASKNISQLSRPFAADQTVYGANILADYASTIKVRGRMVQVDNKLRIGGATQGGGVSGLSKGTVLDFEMDSPIVGGDEVVVVDSGGNTTDECIISLRNITDATGTALVTSGNSVSYEAVQNIGQAAIRELNCPRDGQVWDVLKVDPDFDGIQIARTSAGAVGAAAGYAVMKDTITGTSYKIQLYV